MWRANFLERQVRFPYNVRRETSGLRHRPPTVRHLLSFICGFPIRPPGTALAALSLMADRSAANRAFLQDVQIPGCPSCPDSRPGRRRLVDIAMRRSGGDTPAEGWWRGRRLVGECVGAVLIVSVVLAYASPPDPSWI